MATVRLPTNRKSYVDYNLSAIIELKGCSRLDHRQSCTLNNVNISETVQNKDTVTGR